MAAEDCNGEPVALSHRNLRIASIFIIMASSLFGALAPVLLSRQKKMHVPKFTFFVCKYFGTGVIIATAWMHLMAPASQQLGSPCLESRLGDYPWAFAIGLMTVMVMFFVEMMAARATEGGSEHSHGHGMPADVEKDSVLIDDSPKRCKRDEPLEAACPHRTESAEGGFHGPDPRTIPGRPDDVSYPPGGEDHLAHSRSHEEGDSYQNLAAQVTALFILEFGIVFHSVFIGLTLGTTPDIVILLIVITFHQMFEGLGLGSRLALAKWPPHRAWMPYLFSGIYALSTPIGIAAGIAAKPTNATTQTLVNGIFDSISAGILMYTGLIELLAHEFMFNPHMRNASLKIQLFAFGCVALGAGLMALLAKWA
jgi:zinc transporter 1/2/3